MAFPRNYWTSWEPSSSSRCSSWVKASRLGDRRDDETGASLILALVFLIVVSLIVISIAGLTANDLKLTSSFASAQSMTSAADGAASVAVQYSRYNFESSTLNTPAPCTGATSLGNLNGQSMLSWCDTEWLPSSRSTRKVIVSVCPSPATVTASTPVACQAAPFLQVIAVYDDFPSAASQSSCVPGTTQATLNATCGSQMTVNSWSFNVTPPIVTSIAPQLCSATSFTITGSGFTPSSTVALVSVPQANQNVVIDDTSATVTTTSLITASFPAIPSGSGQFYVVVTGATGSNPLGSTTLTANNTITC